MVEVCSKGPGRNVVQFLIGSIKQAIVLGAGTESKNSGLFFKVNY